MKYLAVCFLVVFLASCASPEKKAANERKRVREIAQCKASGSRVVYFSVFYTDNLQHCVSPAQDARSLQLASACMAGGNIPVMNSADLFDSCEAPKAPVAQYYPPPIDYSSVTESLENTRKALRERTRTPAQTQTTCRSNSRGTVNCTSY
jgi:hypothetical protein